MSDDQSKTTPRQWRFVRYLNGEPCASEVVVTAASETDARQRACAVLARESDYPPGRLELKEPATHD